MFTGGVQKAEASRPTITSYEGNHVSSILRSRSLRPGDTCGTCIICRQIYLLSNAKSMPLGEALDDDYVINLLKKDAEANQKRYLTTGLGSLLTKHSRGNAPKPNTRFLKNIIKETDNHNATLKLKEEEESRRRLRELRKGKRRLEPDDVTESSSKRRRGEEKQGRWANALGGLGGNAKQRADQRSRHDSRPSEGTRKPSEHGRHDRSDSRRQLRARNERSPERAAPRSRSSTQRSTHVKYRSRSPEGPSTASRHHRIKSTSDRSTTPDPLEDFLGPHPPSNTAPRGRGAQKSPAMDDRFDPSYNPKSDVDLEPDEDRDDWDMALEALRDRAKWQAQGADRLRAAGFTEQEVSKWEKGGEKDVDDVRWRKKGEGREWDRGKVVGSDGRVDVAAAWVKSR